jgi:hypothetical protein
MKNDKQAFDDFIKKLNGLEKVKELVANSGLGNEIKDILKVMTLAINPISADSVNISKKISTLFNQMNLITTDTTLKKKFPTF